MKTSHAAFLSYVRHDDKYRNGAITKLREKLSDGVHSKTGKPFTIFQDHADIDWGQPWPEVLDAKLSEVRFLIVVLSPSFFRSKCCRKELQTFLGIEKKQGRRGLIFPLIWEACSDNDNIHERTLDPLAARVADRQSIDWRPLHNMPIDHFEVMTVIDRLAVSLKNALERFEDANKDDIKGRFFATVKEFPKDTYEAGQYEGGTAPESLVGRPESEISQLTPTVQIAKPSFSSEDQAPNHPEPRSDLPEPGTIFRDIDEPWCPEMIVIPAGSFVMGSPPDEEGHDLNEEPEHRVRFAEPFALGVHPVTFDEFDYFCNDDIRRKPSDQGWGRGRRPVIDVNVQDIEAYLAWLLETTGQLYCLPSESMWEYACRARTTTSFSTGSVITADQANYDINYLDGCGKNGKYRKQTTEVGSFSANSFGLFDMHGNVWERCADPWHNTYDGAPNNGLAWLKGGDASKRVLRGGSWFVNASYLRSARRDACGPDDRSNDIGFRCARVQKTSR